MPVLLVCSCGKSLNAPDNAVGQRVKCPYCGAVLTIPAASAASAAAAIRFSCRCGQQMQAPAEYAGRTTQCVGCKSPVVVPAADAPPRQEKAPAERTASFAPAEAGMPPPPPPRDDRVSAEPTKRNIPPIPELPVPKRDGDRENRGAPQRLEKWKETGRRLLRSAQEQPPVVLLAGAAAVLLFLLVGGTGAYFLFRSRTPSPAATTAETTPALLDQAFIPGDAQGFAMLRVAEVWKLDAVQKLVAKAVKDDLLPSDPAALASKTIGLSPADVERLTVVFVDAPKDIDWGVVTTIEPYDRTTILAKLPNPKEVSYEGSSYHQAEVAGDKVGVYFAGDHQIVVAQEPGMKRYMTFRAGNRPTGPLDAGIKRATEGKHHLFVEVNAPRAELEKQKSNFRGVARAFLPFLALESASLTIHAGDSMQLAATMKFSSEEEAKKARRVLVASREAMSLFLLPNLPGLGSGEEKPETQQRIEQLQALLDEIAVKQTGAEVSIEWKAESKGLESVIQLGKPSGDFKPKGPPPRRD